MLKSLKPTIILLTVSLLIACTSAPETGFIEDRILVWHGWSGAEEAALQVLVNDFTSLNPNARVIVANPWSAERDLLQLEGEGLATLQDLLLGRFTWRAQLGLGPDLLIGPSDWVRQLANAGLIQDLSGRVDDTSSYLSSAVETVRYQPPGQSAAGLYGLPLTLETVALYYNKTMITTPADTLDMQGLFSSRGDRHN